MRTYVSKCLLGIDTANVFASTVNPEDLTEGQLIVLDWDTQKGLVAGSKNIGFAKGTAVLGEPILAGPFPKAGLVAKRTPYAAPVKQKRTLTVDAVPTVGEVALIKVVYHDSLSIIPNQTKQTFISVKADAVNAATTTTWAAAIAAEFAVQIHKYVTVTSATNVVTFEAVVLTTASNYNGIDRPEAVLFEVGAPDEPKKGTYTVAQTVAHEFGSGNTSQMQWMEEQFMGRLGYADRRMWNNTKSYQSQVDVAVDYEQLVITADYIAEGDMQGVRHNPVGAVIGAAAFTLIKIDLAVAGIVPEDI